jgi:ectoine hydroxylase-related dioxygenase (phytanoyl-CoA dioxygenase family)
MKISIEEINKLSLNKETIDLAVNLVKVNGYVILEGVLPKEKVVELRKAFIQGLDWFIEKHGKEIYEKKKGFNEGTNHLGILLPFVEPFIDPLVIEHPFALAVIDRLLGKDCTFTLFSSNTSLPGGQKTQPVHSDSGAHYGDLFPVALPLTEVVLNIPLVDVDDNNGPMEIWPGGTHLLPDNAYGPNGYNLEQLSPHMQSMKVHMPAGSILIRDARMWHRGTPNRGNEPRPNIALIYSAYGHDNSISIPQETYDNLSERAKHLFRAQKIGYPAIEFTHE